VAVEMIDLRRPVPATTFPGLAPVAVVARRAMRGAVIWGAVFGLTAWELVQEFDNEYPTTADRVRLVETMASDVGQRALFGPAHHLDTVPGYVALHLVGIFGIMIGTVWALLAGTRLVRGEEEAGRWELVLAGRTTRRRAAAGALAGLGVGLVTFWAVIAAALVLVGRSADARFSVSASLFAATATVAAPAMFLAVGALCSQLATTRRQAAGLAAAAFGVAYLIRAVAYSGTTLRWMRWVSPFVWVDELRALTESRPLLLVPIAATIGALAAATILLAGRRDLGAGILPSHDTAPPRTRFLNDPLGLAYRLDVRTVLGWTAGLAAGGVLFGTTTKSAEQVWENQSGGVIQRLGGATGGTAYLGVVFLIVALLVAVAAAAQVTATREEEAEGYLDHLLARPVARLPWLVGRFAVSAMAVAGFGVAAGLFTWLGATITGSGVSLPSLLAAGVNVVPVGIFVLGIGTLAHGFAPRLTGGVAYGIVAWSFLVEVVGASIGASRWLLDLSILHHIARAPAADVRWYSAAILVALGVAAAALGALAFARRDLEGA
jgi:ABC-2 type transport system permease protein